MNAPAVGLLAAAPRLAAVEADLLLIDAPEACVRNGNAGSFDAALYVGHDWMGWHALTIRAADENLLDLSIATKGGLACRSVVVSMVPAAAAGVEFARLEDAKVGPFLPGARVTCVMLVITRGQSPFLIGLCRQVQFQRSVLGVLVREVRSLLAREARGHHVNWFNCCGPGSLQTQAS